MSYRPELRFHTNFHHQIKPRLQLRSEKQSSHQGEKTTLDETTETRGIRLKIHPLEIEEKASEISDGFRSKNPPRIDLEQSPENRSGAEPQKQEKSDYCFYKLILSHRNQ